MKYWKKQASILKKNMFSQGYVVLMGSHYERFDFAIFDDDGEIDFLIEYQGKQHYEPSNKFGGKKGLFQQQFNDNKKRRFCALNDIKLIEIPYYEEDLVDYDYIMKKAGY